MAKSKANPLQKYLFLAKNGNFYEFFQNLKTSPNALK